MLKERVEIAKEIMAGNKKDLNDLNLAKWHHAWIACNPKTYEFGRIAKDSRYDERPAEFVFRSSEVRRKLLRIITNKVYFCLVDPERTFRQVTDLMSDYISAFKSTTI